MKRVTTLTSIIIVVFSGAIALWATALAFMETIPGVTAAYQVQTLDDPATGPEILSRLIELSHEHDAYIGAFNTAEHGEDFALYSTMPGETYRGILPSQQMDNRPLTELPHSDPRTLLMLQGSADFHHAVVQELEQRGAGGMFFEVREWNFLLDGTDLARFIFLGLGAIIASMFVAAFAHVKTVGISRLLGNGIIRLAAGMMFRPLLWGWLGLCTVFALMTALRGLDIGLQFGRYLLLSGVFYTAVSALSLLLSLALMHFTKIIPTISGKIVVPPLLAASGIVRVVLVGVCLSWCTVAVGYHKEFQKQQPEVELWNSHPITYAAHITGARDFEERAELRTDLANTVRDFSAQQKVFYHRYAAPVDMSLVGGMHAKVQYNGLAAQSSLEPQILDIINRHPADTIVSIAPSPERYSREDMLRDVKECGNTPERCVLEYAPGDYTALTWVADDFQYKTRSSVTNPVVTVFPPDLTGLDDYAITSSLSLGEVSFSNLAAVQEFTSSDERFSTYFLRVVPLAQQWLVGHEKLKIARTMAFIGAGLSAALILTFGLFYGVLLLLGYGQRARTYQIFGVPAWQFYKKVLLWDALVLVGSAAVVGQKVATYLQFASMSMGPMPEEFLAMFYVSPVAIALTALCALAGAGLSVWTISRRLSC